MRENLDVASVRLRPLAPSLDSSVEAVSRFSNLVADAPTESVDDFSVSTSFRNRSQCTYFIP